MKRVDNKGFTLIELLISIAVFSIVSGAIYKILVNQMYLYSVNESVVEMNQSLRGAMYMMERDIMMAGYSGGGSDSNIGIQRANATDLMFSFISDKDAIDNDNDGDIDEAGEITTIQYSMYDSDGDGKNDDIGRIVDNNTDPDRPVAPLAEDMEQLEFVYTISGPGGAQIQTTDPDFDQLDDLIYIDVSMLIRNPKRDSKYRHGKTYTSPSGVQWGPYNDGYRRGYVTQRIFCRNI